MKKKKNKRLSNDPRAKWAEKLIENPLGLEDTFAFKCKACGSCCRNREDVLLSGFDIYRISKYLNIKPHETFGNYCEVYTGHTSGLSVVRLKPKPVPNMLLMMPKPYVSACPLLSNGICSVHKAKPLTCALFPLGRIFDAGAKKIIYVINEATCGDSSEKHTVKDWLATFNIPEHDDGFILWSDFLTKSVQTIKEFKTVKAKELLLNAFFNLMYLTYDITQEFLPQLERNIKGFREIVQSMKYTLQ